MDPPGPERSGLGPAAPAVRELAAELAALTTRPWTLMEVCGGQTHAILRWGLDQLLPSGLRLIHGPGCPVCVTAAETLDAAVVLAEQPEVILASYGDMLRVPGSSGASLLSARAAGGDVRLLTSPQQALDLARTHPQRQVVFLAVGFETTAPATALLARQALALDLANLSILTAHVRVAPAMEALLQPESTAPEPTSALPPVQGFLAAGHVAAVIGTAELEDLVARQRLPVVVSGFEPDALMRGVLACVRQLEAGEARLLNAYGPVVRPQGNPTARALIEEVFEVVDRPWRGLGVIAGGGLALRGRFARLEARRRFQLPSAPPAAKWDSTDCPSCPPPPRQRGPNPADDPKARTTGMALEVAPSPPNPCIAGAILRGRALPSQCPAFGTSCTPEHPLGAPMVSSEGACAAYQRFRTGAPPPR